MVTHHLTFHIIRQIKTHLHSWNKKKKILANDFYNVSHGLLLGSTVCEASPWWRRGGAGALGPVVVAHSLFDVVQFGLQIFAPALLHPIVRRLWGEGAK